MENFKLLNGDFDYYNVIWNKHLFVPTFEENKIFLLGMVFYSVNFFRLKKKTVFNIFFPPLIEDIDLLSSHIKKILPPIIFS